MPHKLKALTAALIIGAMPAVLAPALSAQTISGLPQAGTQTQLGNCNLHQWLWLRRQAIGDVQLPPGARVVDVSQGPQHNFDNSRLTVVTSRWNGIVRVYCG